MNTYTVIHAKPSRHSQPFAICLRCPASCRKWRHSHWHRACVPDVDPVTSELAFPWEYSSMAIPSPPPPQIKRQKKTNNINKLNLKKKQKQKTTTESETLSINLNFIWMGETSIVWLVLAELQVFLEKENKLVDLNLNKHIVIVESSITISFQICGYHAPKY